MDSGIRLDITSALLDTATTAVQERSLVSGGFVSESVSGLYFVRFGTYHAVFVGDVWGLFRGDIMSNYVVYHLHSSLSLLDSCTNYQDYILRAKELGQKAICFTEHGNIYNWIEKKMYCEATQYKYISGDTIKYFDDKKKLDKYLESDDKDYEIIELLPIKYMHGVEAYLTEVLSVAEKKIRDNYHTILIAKDEEGFKELNSLVDLSSQPDHFYYDRRISFDEFLNISDHIIKISACLASPLRRYRGNRLGELLNHYDYYEIQPHVNSEDQKEYNIQLVKWSVRYGKPLIAATDTHSLNQYKAECRRIRLQSKNIKFQNEDTFDLTYKTYDELVEMFKEQGVVKESDYLEAIENTNRMADSVSEFKLDTSFKYPKLYDDEETVLKQLINDNYKAKIKAGIIERDPRYKENVQEEMRVFKKIGMVGFMLFMSELVRWCWDNGIPVGPCRGSVGGSTIAYLSDIIDVNPIVWNTVFSRFANEDRKEIGDIDIDISPSQRELVYQHIIDTFGNDKTAYVLAITTTSGKGTIDDIARALAKDRTDDKYSLSNTKNIKDLYEEDEQKAREEYPELFYYFDGMVNTPVSQSMHPAGIIVSPVTLPDNYGTFWNEGKRILSINMEEIHEVSLVKYDLLGLKNIEIIKDTCLLAGIPYPKSHMIDWDDQDVWEHITDSPVGIFQFEGDYAFNLLKKFQPRRINDLSLVNASLRPSGESYRDRLIARETNKNPSELIDNLLAQNGGFLVYQEDVLAFLQNICGLSGSEADNVRRAIGRKQMDRLQAALPDILEGYCSKSDKPRKEAEEEAKTFLKIIEDSSNYMFGYNHSTGYSMIGYMCGYLRYYYPVEFTTAYLNNANNEDDIHDGTELAKTLNIRIDPIKFRYSIGKYSCNAKQRVIYKGLSSIKYMSDAAAEDLYGLKDNDYKDLVDLLTDIKELRVDSRQLDILIKLNFFNEFGKINQLLAEVELFNKLYNRKSYKVADLEKISVPLTTAQKYCQKSTEKTLSGLDWKGLCREAIKQIDVPETTFKDNIRYENEFLGYVQTVKPNLSGDYYFVQNASGYNNNLLTLYQIKTGKVSTVKNRSKKKVKADDMIKIPEIIYDHKFKKEKDGDKEKWVALDEREYVIKKFSFLT